MPTATVTIELPCSLVTNHPAANGQAIKWTASAERLDNDILIIRNAVPDLGALPKLADNHSDQFIDTTVIGEDLKEYSNPGYRRGSQLVLAGEECPDDLLFYGLLCRSVEPSYITSYLEHVNQHAVVHVGSGYNLVRYHKGGFFKTHVDVTRDHPVLGHRRLSLVLFCNDDFDGGELVFPRQGLTIKPETGLMVMFPSGFTHPHESTEITCGTKYSIVSWFF